MSNEIVNTEQNIQIDSKEVKKYIAPTATDKELYFFLNIAKAYGLNPFKREVHFIKYGNQPGQTIVGYEIYIKRAERTGLLDGWNVYIDKDNVDEKAVIEIYRKDRNHVFCWEVYRKEFDKQQSVWKTMPYFMLKKVAISQGFRLAFPEEIGGMPYTPDEINVGTSESLQTTEVHNPNSTPTVSQPNQNVNNHTGNVDNQAEKGVQLATQKQLNLLHQQLRLLTTDKDEMKQITNTWLENNGYEKVETTKELTKDTASKLIEAIKIEVEKEEEEGNPLNKSSEEMDSFPDE